MNGLAYSYVTTNHAAARDASVVLFPLARGRKIVRRITVEPSDLEGGFCTSSNLVHVADGPEVVQITSASVYHELIMVLNWIWTMAWPSFPPLSTTFIILLVLLLPTLFFLLLSYLSRQPSHPDEPPILPCPLPIPYIGHLILMVLQGGHYIRSLGLAHPEIPIFTLVVAPSFGGGGGGGGRGQGRMYIVTSPGMTAAVQRKSAKEMSANKHLPGVVSKIMGLDAETRGIVERGIVDDDDDGKQKGVMEDLHGMMVGYLGVGQELDQLTLESARALVREADGFLDGLKKHEKSKSQGGETETEAEAGREEDPIQDLLPWVRHLVIVASARVLYGSRNPFAVEQQQQQRQHRQRQQQHDSEDAEKRKDERRRRRQEGKEEEEEENLETDFWNWDHGLGQLLVGVWPSVIARVPYFARERLVAAFRRYIDAEEYEPEDAVPTSDNSSDNSSDSDNNNININDNDSNNTNKGEKIQTQENQPPRTGASHIVLNRIRIARSHGFSPDGVARSELSFLFAAMVNTATVAFWTLLRVYADQELLRAVRDELVRSDVVRYGGDAGGSTEGRKRYLSLSALTRNKYQACPTLHAIFQEVLRLGSNNFSTRLVQEDTYVTVPTTSSTTTSSGRNGQRKEKGDESSTLTRANGNVQTQYLLQKGAIVQIAGGVMHLNRSLWGEDAEEFRPERYLGRQQTSLSSTKKVKSDESHPDTKDMPGDTIDSSSIDKSTINNNRNTNGGNSTTATLTSAFRGFGGGKTICPGRYFATAEILGFVACVVLRMEMEGVADGDKQQRGGSIKVPELDDYILPVHILEPAPGEAVRVRMRLREGAEGERIEVVP